MKHSNFNYSFSLLNNISTMLGMYNFMHSEQAKETFIEIAQDDFEVDFAVMTQEEAAVLNNLIKLSDSLLLFSKMQPEIETLFPKEIFMGVSNVNQKLKPFEEYINGIATGIMTNAEAEHKILQWGCQKMNDEYLYEMAESL
jgi:hypothetical protein